MKHFNPINYNSGRHRSMRPTKGTCNIYTDGSKTAAEIANNTRNHINNIKTNSKPVKAKKTIILHCITSAKVLRSLRSSGNS